MAQIDLLRRLLDAGAQFTQLTQKRAEEVVRDLVKAGEVQAEQAQQVAQDLFDRSRRNTERLVELVRREVRDQLEALGVIGKGPTSSTSTETGRAAAPAKKATAKKAAPRKAAAKKAPAKRAPAKKAAG